MQDAAIRASWKSFLALLHLYGDKCSSVGEMLLRRLQQGMLNCTAAALQAGSPSLDIRGGCGAAKIYLG